MPVEQFDYLYLHGFASSPQSGKAQYLQNCFSSCQINLKILDLNQGDFSHLTLTRQLEQVAAEFGSNPVTLIGSSFGGLTAAWLAQKYPQVKHLILLAPAFGFLSHYLPKLGETEIKQWQESGYLSVYHYGEGRSLPLHYQFVADASQYEETQLDKPLPTLIFHGLNDDVIPIEASRDYAAKRPWVELIELDSDHTLNDRLSEIWLYIRKYCHLIPD